MKKLFFAIAISFCALILCFQNPVQADLNSTTINCFIRSMVHVDGSYSEKEGAFLEKTKQLPFFLVQDIKQDCMTTPKQLLKDLQAQSKNKEAAFVLVISAYIAKADGEVTPAEQTLLEDFLEIFNKKRQAQPLLDICEGEITDEVLAKVRSLYSFEKPFTINKARRAEVPMNLKAIKTAQIAYMQDYDVYVKCSAYPPAPSVEPQKWDASASGGFKTIDFKPGEDVRGSYMVSTTSINFTAIGIIDVDGDGVYATYIATKTMNPNSPITPADVY